MKNITTKSLLFSSLALLLTSCITPFTPDNLEEPETMMVIEGDILLGDTTFVYLSYSQPINKKAAITQITNATVWVENQLGNKFSGTLVKRNDRSFYKINTVNLSEANKYKLVVTMTSGKRYESPLSDVLISPDIDKIGFLRDTVNKKIKFYVNTQDHNNSTHYYKWKYKEDWEFTSEFFTTYEYNPVTEEVVMIPWEKNRYYCWNKGVSTNILIASTKALEQDLVYQKELVIFGSRDIKISYLYSMELTQLAISEEAYIYWDNIKRNSDAVGSIFSPQPTEIEGNIRNLTSLKEKVIGFVSVSKVKKQRIFATHNEMKTYDYDPWCDLLVVNDLNRRDWDYPTLWQSGYDVTSYSFDEEVWAPKNCVDCRLKGTKIKPSFWPNDDL